MFNIIKSLMPRGATGTFRLKAIVDLLMVVVSGASFYRAAEATQNCNSPVFSIDAQSASMGIQGVQCAPPDAITEGDLLYHGALTNCISGFPPGVQVCRDAIGLQPFVNCSPGPGMGCGVEVDAIAVGQDELPPGRRGCFKFSVDRAAEGFAVGTGTYPTVFTEGALGAGEAGADVFVDLGIGVSTPPPPIPPGTTPVGNVEAVDGDGCRSSSGFASPGMGLQEGSSPSDNVDALEMDQVDLCGCGVFFSLSNSSAAVQSPYPGIGTLSGGDILLAYSSPCTGTANVVVRFRTASSLGLNPTADDLDALALTNQSGPNCGAPPFPPVPILFSVTPGSSIVGMPDSRYSTPIEPGDILEPPASPGMRPRIYIPAEVLGLKTMRTHGVADNLDALVVTSLLLCNCNGNTQEDAVDIALGASDCDHNGVIDTCETLRDCNGNTVYDACDIANGSSTDFNHDGVPDECESGTFFCIPGQSGIIPCPCANPPAGGGLGCNNFGAGPAQSGTLAASGIADDSADTTASPSILLEATGENNTSLTVFWSGRPPAHPTGVAQGAGVRCVTVQLKRLYTGNAAGGAITRPRAGLDPCVSDRHALTGAPLIPPETRYYFNIYRDPAAAGPCGSTSATINLTNAYSLNWVP